MKMTTDSTDNTVPSQLTCTRVRPGPLGPIVFYQPVVLRVHRLRCSICRQEHFKGVVCGSSVVQRISFWFMSKQDKTV